MHAGGLPQEPVNVPSLHALNVGFSSQNDFLSSDFFVSDSIVGVPPPTGVVVVVVVVVQASP